MVKRVIKKKFKPKNIFVWRKIKLSRMVLATKNHTANLFSFIINQFNYSVVLAVTYKQK